MTILEQLLLFEMLKTFENLIELLDAIHQADPSNTIISSVL